MENDNKVYVKIWARPLGAEPIIFKTRPKEVEPEIVEIEPGYFQTNPWSEPSIFAFDSVFEAYRFFKENYPTSYSELRIVE